MDIDILHFTGRADMLATMGHLDRHWDGRDAARFLDEWLRWQSMFRTMESERQDPAGGRL